MARLVNSIRGLVMDEDGATMVEYALLVALIAVITIAGVQVLGENTNATLETAADAIAQ